VGIELVSVSLRNVTEVLSHNESSVIDGHRLLNATGVPRELSRNIVFGR
jgi:hypothetical protein